MVHKKPELMDSSYEVWMFPPKDETPTQVDLGPLFLRNCILLLDGLGGIKCREWYLLHL